MNSLSKREINLLVILLVVLIVAGYYNFFLRGYLDDNASLTDQIVSTRASINDAKIRQTALTITQNRIEELTEELENYGKTYLPGLDRPLLIRVFDEKLYPLADDVTIRFPVTYTENLQHRIYTVELSFQTTAQNYERILTNLKNIEYANKVSSANISIFEEEEETIYAIRMNVEFLTKSNEMADFKIPK